MSDSLETYTESRLRDNDGMERIELTLDKPYDNEISFQCSNGSSTEDSCQRYINRADERVPNAWLSELDLDLAESSKGFFDDNEHDVSRSMSVRVLAENAKDVSRHLSFGFYAEGKSRESG